jgi:hypothetical protein
MNETSKSENKVLAQPALPARKPWHAPLLMVTEADATYAVHNAASDGMTVAPTLS